MLQFNNVITFESGKYIPNLENGVYSIQEDSQGNIFLQVEPDFETIELSGESINISSLVIDHYRATTNNFGILLQGSSGNGKTQTIKHICKMLNLPVIMVNKPFLGPFVKSVLDKIGCDCIVVFDEFEKVYAKTEQSESLLGLFDGIDTTNRILYVVSANERKNVSQYFFGRPGRFLFNFLYECLKPEEGLKFIKLKSSVENDERLLNYLKGVNNLSYDICDKISSLINIHGEEKFSVNAKYFNVIPIKYEYEYEIYYNDKIITFGRVDKIENVYGYAPIEKSKDDDDDDDEVSPSELYRKFISKGKIDQVFVCQGENLYYNIPGAKVHVAKRVKLWNGPETVAY